MNFKSRTQEPESNPIPQVESSAIPPLTAALKLVYQLIDT